MGEEEAPKDTADMYDEVLDTTVVNHLEDWLSAFYLPENDLQGPYIGGSQWRSGRHYCEPVWYGRWPGARQQLISPSDLVCKCQTWEGPSPKACHKTSSLCKWVYLPTHLYMRLPITCMARFSRDPCGRFTTRDVFYWQVYPWNLSDRVGGSANKLPSVGCTYLYIKSHVPHCEEKRLRRRGRGYFWERRDVLLSCNAP